MTSWVSFRAKEQSTKERSSGESTHCRHCAEPLELGRFGIGSTGSDRPTSLEYG